MSHSQEINGTEQTSSSYRCFDSPYAKPLYCAVGIIMMIGGLIASGLLYPSYAAFGTMFGGFVLGIIWIAIPLCKGSSERERIVQPLQREVIQLNYRMFNVTAAYRRNDLMRNRPPHSMSDYSIIAPQVVEQVKNGNWALPIERSIGVMLGMAVGDAAGAPYEFLSYRAEQYGENEQNNRFQLQAGQWTDDTSMGLCLADMLITYPEELCESELMWAFYDWWHHGYNNAFTQGPYQRSVGLGGNISASMRAFNLEESRLTIIQSLPTTAGDRNTSGNGSLMRNGPVALYARSVEEAMVLAERQSRVTHQGNEAAACCRLMAFIIYHAIHDVNENPVEIKQALLAKLQDFNSTVVSVNGLAHSQENVANAQHPQQMENWNWQNENYTFSQQQLNRPNPGYAGAYAMDGLAMALHCVFTTNSFEAAIQKATRHGGDADTVGAITGQIAGAIYGRPGIPQDLVNNVQQWDRGGEIAARGYLLATRE